MLPRTHERLVEALSAIDSVSFELVYVDDGSSDGTAAILEGLQADDDRVRVLRLSRNFGHQIAITAGIEHAAGDAVVVIDADLQDPPELIAEMVGRWREGFKVVYAERTGREGESALKLATARTFYRLLSRISDTDVPLDVGDFRLMDRQVVDAFLAMPERDRFVRGMVSWVGFPQAAVPFRRQPRAAGETKYPFFRMLAFAADAIVSFSFAPLRLATWLGFLSAFLALGGIAYAFAQWVVGNTVAGWTTVFVAVLFLGGVQLIALGIVGEYVGRIYREAKRRPLYLVERRLGFAEADSAVEPQRDASLSGR